MVTRTPFFSFLSQAARGYDVTLTCRDAAKAAAAVAACAAAGATVSSDTVDLADLASVREFATRFTKTHSGPLDVLVLNAGVMACPKSKTRDGFDLQFGTNHLGHYVLTLRLLPLLLKADKPRVVTVSALAHRVGSLSLDDPNYERRRYNRVGAYAQSKLANVLFASELARRSDNRILSHSLHPGVVATGLVRHIIDPANPRAWQKPIVAVFRKVLKTPAQGAATSIYVATSDDDVVINSNGGYFSDCKPAATSAAAKDAALAAGLWDLSAKLTGEDGSAGGLLKV